MHSIFSCRGNVYANFDFLRFLVFELQAHDTGQTDRRTGKTHYAGGLQDGRIITKLTY